MKRNLLLSRLSIFSGIACLIAAGMLYVFNTYEDMRASERSLRTAEKIAEQLPPFKEPDPLPSEMPVMEIDGVEYIGILSIPDQSITLPVAKEWSYPQLKVSPCLFAGSTYNRDLVILAHNYKHHFWPLLDMEIGKELYFTAADGSVYHYLAGSREYLSGEDYERLIQDGTHDWTMSLVTCTPGGWSRCVIRCVPFPKDSLLVKESDRSLCFFPLSE